MLNFSILNKYFGYYWSISIEYLCRGNIFYRDFLLSRTFAGRKGLPRQLPLQDAKVYQDDYLCGTQRATMTGTQRASMIRQF